VLAVGDAIGLSFIIVTSNGFVKAFAEYKTGFANNKNCIIKGIRY
jgi:hypothetical protein